MEHGNSLLATPDSESLSLAKPARVGSTQGGIQATVPVNPPIHLHETELLVIEACAGSAMLSSVLHQDGFKTVPLDFGKPSTKRQMPVLNLDLRSSSSWEFLRTLTLSFQVIHFHGAPPCGTASRDKDTPMSATQHGPAPLRSMRHPEGLPGLTGVNLARVQSANLIYNQMAAFCLWLHDLNVGYSIENPGNSYMWELPLFKQLQARATRIAFHSCCHGSEQQKLTVFLSNVQELEGLRAVCQGDHNHLSWGLIRNASKWEFATAAEAAYPKLLCSRISTLLQLRCLRLGLKPVIPEHPMANVHAARAATGRQPRGQRLPPLIPEFHYTVEFRGQLPALDSKLKLISALPSIPAKSKMLRACDRGNNEAGHPPSHIFGVYHTPEAFVSKAMSLIHPFDCHTAVPDDMLQCIFNVLTQGPVSVMKHRLGLLKEWKNWACELEPAEARLRESMSLGRRAVLEGKRILLMKKVASSLDWPDMSLFDELQQGFRLSGNQPATGIFAGDAKPPLYSESELLDKGKFLRPALWGKIQSEPLQDYAQVLWDKTLDEAGPKGWLQGPFSLDELNFRFQHTWLPVRRFAVYQKGKWRPIDDLTENGVNGSFGSMERVDLKALDETVWAAVALMRSVRTGGHVSFTQKSGHELSGSVHPYWTTYAGASVVTCRTVDLKSAYKQLPLADSEVGKVVVCLKCPADGKVYGFPCRVVPFGGVASVLHFNRFARFLRKVLHSLWVMTSNYFDDYPILELSALTSNADATVRAVMRLFGVTVAEDKEVAFDQVAELLGVSLDLSDPSLSSVKVANKAGRARELAVALEGILQAGVVRPRELPSLFGRLQFSEAQILGRAGRLAIADIRHLEKSQSSEVRLDVSSRESFQILLQRLVHSRPRCVSCSALERPVLVFTDGAFEPSGVDAVRSIASVGAVMFCPTVDAYHVRSFGCVLPGGLLQDWASGGKKHLIGETEMYAVVLSRIQWSSYLANRRVIFFVDHGGVMGASIRGTSKDKTWRSLLMKFELADEASPSLYWFSRVPSESNISDGPSRGCFSLMDSSWKYVRDRPRCIFSDAQMADSESLQREMGG